MVDDDRRINKGGLSCIRFGYVSPWQNILLVAQSFYKFDMIIFLRPLGDNAGGLLGVDIGDPLRSNFLTDPKWAASVYLRFKSEWLRNLSTWSYFNLSGLWLVGVPRALVAAYIWSSTPNRRVDSNNIPNLTLTT